MANILHSNELRIGNLVLSNANNEILEVESIGIDGINLYSQGDYEGHHYLDCDYKFSEISPIPLTEEWLIKFGFEFVNNDNQYGWYKFFDRRFSLQWCHSDIIDLEDGDYETSFSMPCKYVHQLQNLYFALTGNELI